MKNGGAGLDGATLAGAQAREGKYLTFVLAREHYGIGILKVREIIGMMPVTPIPRTPDFVKGVTNLRGRVIPVLDLRLKFGLDAEDYDDRTCIIVVEAEGQDGRHPLGLVVDAVNEVANIREEDVEDPPRFGLSLESDFILGMAKAGPEVKILLDIDRVLSQEEFSALARVA